jgi:hypothetical protein
MQRCAQISATSLPYLYCTVPGTVVRGKARYGAACPSRQRNFAVRTCRQKEAAAAETSRNHIVEATVS